MSPAPSPRTSRGRSGIAAEAVAGGYLEASGWTILGANVLVGRGELDLVALDPDVPGTLVVVEVRGARSGRYGASEESVGFRKLARLRAAVGSLLASSWPREHGIDAVTAIRLDVIAVDLEPAVLRIAGEPQVRHIRGVTDL